MYDFKQLSPADFEDLTRDLLQQEWRVRLETFKSGRDQGIDLRYSRTSQKSTIIQCKRYADSSVSKLVSHLKLEEKPKIVALAPKRYVLVTALPLNPADKERIRTVLSPYIKSHRDIFSAEDVNNLIGRFPEIETQHFKLWLSSTAVLDRVLRNANKVQTDYDVDRVRRLIPLYVQNRTFNDAVDILERNRFVIISGVPGIGKTTLADMLLFAFLEDGYEPVVIQSDIREGREMFKRGKKQVFYFDDFLGQTFLGNRLDFLGRKEDAAVLDFMEMIANDKRKRMILTTREHILRHAFQLSERFQRKQLELTLHQYILEMDDYSLLDRGRILYNHIYFSNLPEEYRRELLRDEFYMTVLKHQNFNPRLIEWLSHYANVRSVAPGDYRKEIGRILNNPAQLWRVAFEQQISDSSRSVLLALYSLGGESDLASLERAWGPLHESRSEKYHLHMTPEDWRRSLRDLEGGFLTYDNGVASFVNPSVNDFFDDLLNENSAYTQDLLTATSTFKQIEQIWAFANSDKGMQVGQRLREAPASLLSVVEQNLRRPHSERLRLEGGGAVRRIVDVGPERRLAVVISIAYRTKSLDAVKIAQRYAEELRASWRTRFLDFGPAVDILKILDEVEWKAILRLGLQESVKGEVLFQLENEARSGDFEVVLDYAEGRTTGWTDKDTERFAGAFDRYIDREFSKEFHDCTEENELNALYSTVSRLGEACGVDVEHELELINERLAEFEDPDDGEKHSSSWLGATQSRSDVEQEDEVRRLFGGLSGE